MIEIESNGLIRTINYDNPPVIILRGNQRFIPQKIYETPVRGEENQGKMLRCMEFYALKEDRIIFLSDGVTQSGIGSSDLKMGWGHQQVLIYLKQIKISPIGRAPSWHRNCKRALLRINIRYAMIPVAV